jgi:dUTP pyrophosphatase
MSELFAISKTHPNASIPVRSHPYDAGLDISSCEKTTVPARGRVLVNTGLSIWFPNDCYARIAPRSGLAYKKGIDVGAGVIDHGYTNTIGVVLFNHTDEDFYVNVGDRIAQLIFEKICIPRDIMVVPYETLLSSNCARGLSGFGSSGV